MEISEFSGEGMGNSNAKHEILKVIKSESDNIEQKTKLIMGVMYSLEPTKLCFGTNESIELPWYLLGVNYLCR